MIPRGWAYAILAAIAVFILWKTGDALYQAGVTAERLRWQEAARDAESDARDREQRDTTASDGARDAAAQEAQQASADTRAGTTETIETIRYVYRTQPAPACVPDPVPDGVRDALSSAYDAAAAAAGRLPAAARPGP